MAYHWAMSASGPSEKPYDLPHEAEVLAVLRDNGVQRAFLFGSAARGELEPESDINLLVDIEGPTDYGLLFLLTETLEEITGHEVVVVDAIKPLFMPYIEPDLVELPL